MSEKTVTYHCETCGKSTELADGDTIPVCCDKEMALADPLPVCQAPAGAEHSRPDEPEEPCDDGRAGVR